MDPPVPNFLHPSSRGRSAKDPPAIENGYYGVGAFFLILGILILVIAFAEFVLGFPFGLALVVALILLTGACLFFAIGTVASDLQKAFMSGSGTSAPPPSPDRTDSSEGPPATSEPELPRR